MKSIQELKANEKAELFEILGLDSDFELTAENVKQTSPIVVWFKRYVKEAASNPDGVTTFGDYMEQAIDPNSKIASDQAKRYVPDGYLKTLYADPKSQAALDFRDKVYKENSGIGTYEKNLEQRDKLIKDLGAYYKKDIKDLENRRHLTVSEGSSSNAKDLVAMVRAIHALPIYSDSFSVEKDFINNEQLKSNPYFNKVAKSYNLDKEYGEEGPSWGAMAFPNTVKGNKTDPETGEDIDSNVFEKGLSLFEDVTNVGPRALYAGVQALTPNSENISFAENMATPSEYNSGEQQLMQDIGIGGIGGSLLNKGARGAYGFAKGAVKGAKLAKDGDKILGAIKVADEAFSKTIDQGGRAAKTIAKANKAKPGKIKTALNVGKTLPGNLANKTGKAINYIATIGEPTADEILMGEKYLTGVNSKPWYTAVIPGAAKGLRDNALPTIGVAATKYNNDKDTEGNWELGAGAVAGSLFGGISGAARNIGITKKAEELINKDFSKRQVANAVKSAPISDSRTGVAQLDLLNKYNTKAKNAIGQRRNESYRAISDVPASTARYNFIKQRAKDAATKDMSVADKKIFDREIATFEKKIATPSNAKPGAIITEKAKKHANPVGIFKISGDEAGRVGGAASRAAAANDPASYPLSQASKYLKHVNDDLMGVATSRERQAAPLFVDDAFPEGRAVPGKVEQSNTEIKKLNEDFKRYYDTTEGLPKVGDSPEVKQRVLNRAGADRASLATNAASLERKTKQFKENMDMLKSYNTTYNLGLDLESVDLNYIKTGIVNSIRNKMPIRDQKNFMQLFNAAADLSPMIKAGKTATLLTARGIASGKQSWDAMKVGYGSLFGDSNKAQVVGVDPFTNVAIKDKPKEKKKKLTYEEMGAKADKAASLLGSK